MLLQKTDKGRSEVRSRERILSLRERSVLLLADGSKSLRDLQPLFDGEAQHIVLRLVQDGYLAPVRADASAPVQAPAGSADTFEGKRSLATTRMFLFDICERMFARRAPETAERLREALRNARDREGMLAACREMIEEIETIAGHERADSISERIAMLLPPEVVT